MMKYFAITLFVIFLSCEKPLKLPIENHNSIGAGIVTISIDKPLYFYPNEDAESALDVMYFEENPDGSYSFETSHLRNRMKPYMLSEGISDEENSHLAPLGVGQWPVLKFRVVKTANNGFTVILNEDTNETAYISGKGRAACKWQGCSLYHESSTQTPFYIYEPWEGYLTRIAYVRFPDKIDLVDKPGGTLLQTITAKESKEKFLVFKVVKVEGDWAQIENQQIQYSGWTKWNDGKKLLITITEFYGEG